MMSLRRELDRLRARLDSQPSELVDVLRMASRDDINGALATMQGSEQPDSVKRWGKTYWQERLETLLPNTPSDAIVAAVKKLERKAVRR